MIEIAQRLLPFSHRPGVSLLIPGSCYECEVFPELVRVYDLSNYERKLVKEIAFDVQGPLKLFTVIQDLERGCVTVFGEGLRYHILPNLDIVEKKNPGLERKDFERVSLGSHKKLEWEKMRERLDMWAVFPLWLRLGAGLSLSDVKLPVTGMFSLLEGCREAIQVNRPEHIIEQFERLFLAAFRGLLVPRLRDEEHQGILREKGENEISPLYLLQASAQLIRSLFVQEGDGRMHVLPHLPPEFACGRFINVETTYGTLEIEWTKKMMRRMLFKSRWEGSVDFVFPSVVKSYRLRNSERERGREVRSGEPVSVERGGWYSFDRFQK